jgi:hypothetical protein
MDIHHVTLTADKGRLPLFPDLAAYNEGLHRIGRVCGGRLCLFALLAEHIHLKLLANADEARRLSRATILSLLPVVSNPLAPSHRKPVGTRSYARWLFKYFLDQPARHDLSDRPALFVGSCLPDLVGARCVPGLELRVKEVLPEFRPARALERVGLPAEPLIADTSALKDAGLERLKEATAAVLAICPTLAGKQDAAVRGRRALATMGDRLGFGAAEIADVLRITRRAVYRLKASRLERSVARAVSRRIALEELVYRCEREQESRRLTSACGS